MKAWRVMGNNLERGTWCEADGITNDIDAAQAKLVLQNAQPDNNFFVQEYEEARTGKLEKRSAET